MCDAIVAIILFVGFIWLTASGGHRKPKQKRCRDCKWFAFDVDPNNFTIQCYKWGTIPGSPCCGYVRKWWKKGRPK